jgi:hypothetical protein
MQRCLISEAVEGNDGVAFLPSVPEAEQIKSPQRQFNSDAAMDALSP